MGQFLEDWRRWLLLGNIIVFVSGESQGGSEGVPGRSVLGAGLFLATVTVGLLVVATVIFRRRDVAQSLWATAPGPEPSVRRARQGSRAVIPSKRRKSRSAVR